jgi:large subunit ribosomal protein L46
MNTWIVGNQPIGHIEIQHAKPRERPASPGTIEQGERTFFVKGRIMAGQANITQNKFGVKDYKWLSREEIQGVVHPRYWSKIQGMLPQR